MGDEARAFNPFTCPNCKALYQVVKVEAGPETTDREITCQVCDGSACGARWGVRAEVYFLEKGHSTSAPPHGQSQLILSLSWAHATFRLLIAPAGVLHLPRRIDPGTPDPPKIADAAPLRRAVSEALLMPCVVLG